MENPVKQVFLRNDLAVVDSSMTVSGTLQKIAILFTAMGVGIVGGWGLYSSHSAFMVPVFWTAFGGSILCAVVSFFRPQSIRYTAIPYALGQGIVLTISALFLEVRYPGIPVTAVLLTLATACAMLLLYRLEVIKVTDQLRSIIVVATVAVGVTYSLVFLLGLFGFNTSLFFGSSSTLSIIFSLFVVGLAAFNLLLDFDLIEQGAENGLPKYMEWFGAFSLLVTLIWLYLEIVRLLVKLADRKK